MSLENNWHYDYVRLAWDTGFSFEKWRSNSPNNNKICIVDIEKVIKERDVAIVDQCIPDILQYLLEEEQTKILDKNFVKMFRISQLAVEFLIFCKKYLDNTVVLLKKELTKNKEEMKELNIFIEELKEQLKVLIKQQSILTFKCNICLKVFSAEEYLNSHMQRKHGNVNTKQSNFHTDKIDLEIKELKERLNTTEKLLEEKNSQHQQTSKYSENDFLKIFEKFREQIIIEFQDLKMQKDSYEENINQILDTLLNKNLFENRKLLATVKNDVMTQTDTILQNIEPCNDQTVSVSKTNVHNESNFSESIIVEKISATLANIEGQMQMFCSKLNETSKTTDCNNQEFLVESEDVFRQKEVIPSEKPKIKPRTKFTCVSKNEDTFIKQVKHEKGPEVDLIIPKTESQEIKSEISRTYEKECFSSTSDSQISEVPNMELEKNENPESSVPTKPFNAQSFKKNVNYILLKQLQNIGISKNWSAIPENTFATTSKLVNHQSYLLKQMYPDFERIKKSIVKTIEDRCTNKEKKANFKNGQKRTDHQNIIKLTCRAKPKRQTLASVTINNRALYETDSDSEYDIDKRSNENFRPSTIYSNVITELKSRNLENKHLTATGGSAKNENDKQKGVLKSFPSVGSLSKKKVIFDIARDDVKLTTTSLNQQKEVQPGGSTTSIASSIFDGNLEDNNPNLFL
ncbi:zinc finger protein DZIP1 [Sitophilus oryzae]|uniref:Zinc finger protein DZIP1 n=1 Tax=Sitophilus oryzae TaxID=7048 RepID=A0A6J2Y2E6_SITOR|nr:zinc finger protein DZIP1 [Sitophilus oryzae]XP_030757997.1 zinc finger protein DZIP1 [Sitophilus oryzae]XP_030757998.1 zinc finger protein DZIP1 [Sitophilus oryzae]